MIFPIALTLKEIELSDSDIQVIKHIFPTKQLSVLMIRQIASTLPQIKKIIVFGSALSMDCGMGSDIDFAIVSDTTEEEFITEIYRKFSDIPSEKDIVDYNHIHNELLKENIDRGFVIYESA